jgi:hypothetical protein
VAGACPKLPSRKALRPQGPGVKPGAHLVAPFWFYGNSRAGVYQSLLRICNGHVVSVARRVAANIAKLPDLLRERTK